MSLMSTIEFNKLLNEDSNNEIDENNFNCNEICLISGEKLTENYTTLSCGHKFNYIQIYNEVKSYKSGKHNLLVNQIKCPYCRNIESKILPYFKMNNVSKIYGVNYPMKYSLMLNTCKIIMKSGKRKGELCGRMCNGLSCCYHNKTNTTNTTNTINK